MNKLIKKAFIKFKKLRKNKSSNLNIFIICTAVIMVWRWVWNIIDMYVFPNNYLFSCIFCVVVWIAILFIDDWKIDELE